MFADTLQVIMNVISADVEPSLHYSPYYALFFFLGCFAGLLVFEFSYAWLNVWVGLPEIFTLGRWEMWLWLGNRWVRYHFHWYRLKTDFVIGSVDSLSCHPYTPFLPMCHQPNTAQSQIRLLFHQLLRIWSNVNWSIKYGIKYWALQRLFLW
jgi:hypothetical protein